MRIASIDRIDYPCGTEQLPLQIQQSCSQWRSALRIVLSLVTIAALLAPVVLIAADVLQKPHAVARMVERPLSIILLLTGLAIALTLMVFPLRSGLSGFARRRTLQVTANGVTIEDRGLLGTRSGFVPMTEYYGLVHHIRATLSGTRHELILLHANREDNVLLSFGNLAPDVGEEHFGRLLGMPQLSAGELYGSRRDPQPTPVADVEITSAAA